MVSLFGHSVNLIENMPGKPSEAGNGRAEWKSLHFLRRIAGLNLFVLTWTVA